MVDFNNITDCYNQYCYDDYYYKPINRERQYEIWAEKEDTAWEDIRDNNFKEEN